MALVVTRGSDYPYRSGGKNRALVEIGIEQDGYAVREDLQQRPSSVRRPYFAAQEREQHRMRLAKAPLGNDTLQWPEIAAIIRHQRRHRAGWMF